MRSLIEYRTYIFEELLFSKYIVTLDLKIEKNYIRETKKLVLNTYYRI